MTTKCLATNYLYKYKSIHVMKLAYLKGLIKTDLKVDMTLTQIRRTKLLTIEKFQGDLKEEYGRLWDYLIELKFNRFIP